jgi:hypothetical protein
MKEAGYGGKSTERQDSFQCHVVTRVLYVRGIREWLLCGCREDAAQGEGSGL